MRRFMTCAGLDGKTDRLSQLTELIRQRQPEVVLFAGGIGCADCVDTSQAGFSPKQLERYTAFQEWARSIDVPIALIPGTHEVPLGEFYQWAANMETDLPHVHVVHGTPWRERDTVVGGMGGVIGETGHGESPRLEVSRAEAEYYLRQVLRDDAPIHVLLFHQPPNGRLGGDAGNAIVGELIDSLHPKLAVVAGPTAQRGIEQVAHTTVVNPGRLSDGSLGYVDVGKPFDERVEWLDLAAGAGV